MAYPADARNLVDLFFHQADLKGDKPFLWRKRDGEWQSLTWRFVAAEVERIAGGLAAMGIGAGERVVIVSENRPEWPIADIAVMALGAIAVPAYITNTTGDHIHILTNSGATAAIVSTAELAGRLLPAAKAAQVHRVVLIDPMPEEMAGEAEGIALYRWTDLKGNGFDGRGAATMIGPDEVACFIYTSGTGGAPRGVMLTHRNILCNCLDAEDILRTTTRLTDEVFLSFLPLSHAYEHTAGMFFPIAVGADIYYAEALDKLFANIEEVRPTILSVVPRLFEVLQGRVLQGLRKAPPFRQKLFQKALDLGIRRWKGERLGPVDWIVDKALDRLVRDKLRQRFGGRVKALISGGAPINDDIALFFLALGLPLLQGYGQTETAPLISVNPPNAIKPGTVGPASPRVTVRIAEDGEICVQGDMVMKGYWGDPQATAGAIRDGWLHTGDIGKLDEDGYITITDRKRDIIKLTGGDTLSPARIEGILCLSPDIAQAMVIGDRRPYLTAILVPSEECLKAVAKETGGSADLAALHAEPKLKAQLTAAVEAMNGGLAVAERVRRFMIAPAAFTTENGQMTPTLKVRRHKVREAYGDSLDALYN